MSRILLSKALFLALCVLALIAPISPALALVLGLGFAVLLNNPYLNSARSLARQSLALAVMGLGAGMDLSAIERAGASGIGYTVIGIGATVLCGVFLGKLLKTEYRTSLLITMGTAICGGSAIAALAPVIRAKSDEVSVALGTVFTLNAIALVLFPMLGHALHLSEAQFGLWSALAIHDTSSVVGAVMRYGGRAIEIGTTVKLARALWIVPLTFVFGFFHAQKDSASQEAGKPVPAKRPWFILGFLVMAAVVTWVPALRPWGHVVEQGAKRLMILTLFLIGSALAGTSWHSVVFRSFAQGILLWIAVATLTLALILKNQIGFL